jgi:hypothetical protein
MNGLSCLGAKKSGTRAPSSSAVSDRLWEIGDIVALIEKAEARIPGKRGPYKKRIA